MKKLHVVLFLLCCLLMHMQQLHASGGPNLSVNVNQAVDVVTSKMTEDLIQKLYEEGEGTLKDYTYFQEIIEPYSAYVDSDTKFTTKGLELYKKLQEDLEGKSPEERKKYFAESFSSNVKGYVKKMAYDRLFDKESQKIISTFQGMLSEARDKISNITEAKQALEAAESSAEYTKILKKYGLNGKWVDGFEDIEKNVNLIKNSKLVGNLTDAYNAYSIVSKGMQSSNPGHKIEALFELGATFGGKVPILGDFIKLYFEVAQAYLEACKGVAKSLRKFDQNCVGEGSHAQIEGIGTDERNVAFSKQFPGSALYCRGAGGIYLDIYQPVTAQGAEENRLYFWVDGKWVEGKESHGGISSLKHIVQWLRKNGHNDKATDIAFLAKEYNKGKGFDVFVATVTKIIEQIQSEYQRVYKIINTCDDDVVKNFMMNQAKMQIVKTFLGEDLNYGWDEMKYFYLGMKEDMLNEFIHRRLIKPEGSRLGEVIAALEKLHPSYVKGNVYNAYKTPIPDAEVTVDGAKFLFQKSSCQRLKTSAFGSFYCVIDLGSNASVSLSFRAKKEDEVSDTILATVKADTYHTGIEIYFKPDNDSREAEDTDSDSDTKNLPISPPVSPEANATTDTNTTIPPIPDVNITDDNTTVPPPIDSNESVLYPCSTDQDCAADEVCSEGVCILLEVEGCTSNQECASDEICSEGICILAEIGGCTSNQDCASDEVCSDAMCIAVEEEGCQSDSDCMSEEVCHNGTCMLPKPSVCESDHDCPLDKVCGLSGVCIASSDSGYNDSVWGDRENTRQQDIDERYAQNRHGYGQDEHNSYGDEDNNRYESDRLSQDQADRLAELEEFSNSRSHSHSTQSSASHGDTSSGSAPVTSKPPSKPSRTANIKDTQKPQVSKLYYVITETSRYLQRTATCSSVSYSVIGPLSSKDAKKFVSQRKKELSKKVGVKRYPLCTSAKVSMGKGVEKKPATPSAKVNCTPCPSGQHIGLDPGKRKCHGESTSVDLSGLSNFGAASQKGSW